MIVAADGREQSLADNQVCLNMKENDELMLRRPHQHLRGHQSVPLHQILHPPVQGDPPGQDFVLLSAGQTPRGSEVAADGAPEVRQLAGGVHAVDDVGRGEARQAAQHLCVRVAMGGELRVVGLQGPPWSAALPF